MLKLINTTGGTVAANNVIPLTLKNNTNGNTSFSSNTITINKAGYYSINATFNVEATATTTNVTLYANGVAIPETAITLTSVAGSNYEIVINDIEKIIRTYPITDKVNLTFVSTTGLTVVNANVSVTEIK